MIVRLSNLKFAEQWNNDPAIRPATELRFTDQESTEPRRVDTCLSYPSLTEPNFQSPAPNEHNAAGLSHKFKHGEPFRDRLSSDIPGEELSHDATVWKLYRSEAEEYDQELVKGRHASLDVLLLFAALFSAILTAFLVESKALLQQDPADSTAALLLIIAQRQINGSTDSTSVELPPFTPTNSALWINGLWFASLGLSLAAALVAMLSKEWLTAYTASRPRPAHTHALLRQARFDSLNSWWALHIIALLPTLLHLSLFLFALGLVVYLWTLDVVVAAIIGGIVALTVVFYLGTTLLGAIVPYCPFVTEISQYLQQIFSTRLGQWLKLSKIHSSFSKSGHGTTTIEDIRAVSWLAENARDPIVIDCSYQALAGIQLPMELTTPDGQSGDSVKHWYKSLGRIFPTMLTRFEAIIRDGNELASARGANLARYARSLVELAAFLDNTDDFSLSSHSDRAPGFRSEIRPRLESFKLPSYSDSPTPPAAVRRAELALEALDGAWRDEHPPFSADAFACLTAAELRLVALNAGPFQQERAPSEVQLDTPVPNATAINVTAPSQERVSLADLRAAYSRSLVRAAIQLRYHSDGRTPIGPFALANLLDALRIGAGCAVINWDKNAGPTGNLDADRNDDILHTPTKIEPPTSFIVPVFNFEHYLRPTDLARGPLGSLIRVLNTTAYHPRSTRAISNSHTGTRFKVRLATARALAALAPVLLRHWMLVKVSRSTGVVPPEITSTLDPRVWPDVDTTVDAPRLETAIVTQLLLVIRIVGPYIERAGALTLVELAVAEMDRIADLTPYSALWALRRHAARDFIPLLEYTSRDGKGLEGHTPLNTATRAHILNLLTFDIPGRTHLLRTHLSAQYVPLLLSVVQGLSNRTTIVRTVLKYVVGRVRETRDNEYLRIFTHSDQGYSALVAIGGAHEDNMEIILNAVLQITHIATIGGGGLQHDRIIIDTPALPGFLDSISLVARHTAQMSGKQNHRDRHLHSFVRNVIALLRRIEPQAGQIVLEHAALDEVINVLQTLQSGSMAVSDLSLFEGTSKPGSNPASKSGEYLLAQLRTLKNQYLPDLAMAEIGERDEGPATEDDPKQEVHAS